MLFECAAQCDITASIRFEGKQLATVSALMKRNTYAQIPAQRLQISVTLQPRLSLVQRSKLVKSLYGLMNVVREQRRLLD